MKESKLSLAEFFGQWERFEEKMEQGIRENARTRIAGLFRELRESGTMAGNRPEDPKGERGEVMSANFYRDDERNRFKHAQTYRKTYEEIEAYLFDEGIDGAEREKRLLLAESIASRTRNLCSEMVEKTMDMTVVQLMESPEFKGYRIDYEDYLYKGKCYYPLRVYKENWPLNEYEVLVSYALEPSLWEFQGLWIGIRSELGIIPYEGYKKGDWRKNESEIVPEAWRMLCGIWKALETAPLRSEGDGPLVTVHDSDTYWPVRLMIYPCTYRNMGVEFYLKLLEKGCEWMAGHYVRMFAWMKNTTEKHLDEFVDFYKKNGKRIVFER